LKSSLKAHRLVYQSTLGWRVIKKKKRGPRHSVEEALPRISAFECGQAQLWGLELEPFATECTPSSSSPRPTRWTATLSEVNLPHATKLRALCGANLVTLTTKFWGNEPLEVLRVAGRRSPCTNFLRILVYLVIYDSG